MNRSHARRWIAVVAFLATGSLVFAQTSDQTSDTTSGNVKTDAGQTEQAGSIHKDAPATVSEARGRARLLHETLHGSLQVMHRDFFRKDESLTIPSRSLEDVFSELLRSYGVKLHWLAVDSKAMNVDHEAESDFEKEAVRALRSGRDEFESVTADQYRFVGKIRLSAVCLSCHETRRSNNDDRAAGLVISMPLKNRD